MLTFEELEKKETVSNYYEFKGIQIKGIINSCELIRINEAKWHPGKTKTYIGVLDNNSIIVYETEHYEDESRHGSSHYCYSHTSYVLFYMGEKYIANKDTNYFYEYLGEYHISDFIKWSLSKSEAVKR